MELLHAVEKNNINEVIKLCNLDLRSKFTGQSDLRSDCSLLNTNIDINLQNNIGWTALMYASKYNKIDIVKLLLKREDIDINIQNKYGWTALMIASRFGKIDIVNLLLQKDDININIQDNIGRTALILASYHGSIDIIKLLNEYNSLLSLTNLI
jgi:ankyrin repeat protein